MLLLQCIEHFSLGNHLLCDSGKFNLLDDLLPQMKDNGDRVLIFTQFVMVMDIMEQYLRIRGHRSVYNFNSKLPSAEKLKDLRKFTERRNKLCIILM